MNWEKVRTAVLSGMLAVSLAAAGPSELLMMGNGGTVVHAEESREEAMIDQSLMTASADSYESGNEPYQALDGDSGTWWHTSWSNRKDLPQSITLTLKEPVDGICQLQYTPRTDKDWNGTILEYKISVSTDGETFTDAAAGTWEATKDKKTATFDSVNQVKAVKLTGITSKGNRETDDSMYVSAAEIRLVSRDSFVKNKEPLEELVEKGKRLTADSQEGKQAILKQLLEEAQEALANPLTVQERLDKLVSELKTVVEPRTSFTGYAGERLFDTNGERIQAHGGQISKWGDTWYWYGEDKTDGWYPRGVHLYTSKDLYNWEDQGVVLKTMKNIEEIDTDPYFHALYGDLSTEERQEVFRHIDYNSSVVERPKVLYNQTTGKYVLWFHADGPDGESSDSYAKAMAGVAIADRPEGPFRFLKAKRLDCSQDYSGSNRGMARDMNLFQDDDGTAYIIYASEENATLYISKLNPEYTDLDVLEGAVEGRDFTRNMVNSSREAPAMFKYQGKYYLMTSGCTGWDPNAAIYYTADSPLGPWTAKGNPCVGEEKDTTFGTQSTCIFPVDAENGKFLYMGDRWNRNDLADSRYVWLPVELGYSGEMKISASSDWAVEDLKEAAFVSLYQKDTVYFVDCNKETSGFFDGFAERKIELLNQTGDQKYDGVWGLTGEPGDYNGDILFGSGYWAKANESIVYRFTLPAGRYQAAAGFREWWSENRQAMLNVKLVENPDTEQEELRSLRGAVSMNTTKDDQSSIFRAAFTLETSGMVEISVDKAGGGDPLLAWMGIVKDTESEDSGTQTEVVEIGSDVWPTPVIPAVPKEQAGVEQSEISLNETTGDGTWKYLYDIPDYTEQGGVPYPTAAEQDFDFRKWENKNWQNIKVPGEALMQGFDILTNNEYYYQREISIPEDFADRQILIRFDGVYCNARVWIDGTYIRTHVGGFTTWDCDITEYAQPGDTVTLTVGVADLYSKTKGIWNPEGEFVNNPSNATEYAHHNIGGINRDVSLVALPYDCIARTYVNTDFDETFTDANLEVTAQVKMKSEKASFQVELLDGERTIVSGKAVFTKQSDGSGLSQAKKLTIPVSEPKKWDAEHPNLYTLRSTLSVEGETVQVNEEKIGFREIHYGGREGTDRNKVYVNGKEVKLRGTCRHDVSDDLGRSMTREECYAEARAYKNANINHIRTSHYPGSEDLLDACDELGIYVEQETAVCFQGFWPSRYEDYLVQFAEMIERDRNRPSILIWSLGNESNYEQIKEQCGGNAIWDEKMYLKDVDTSRPCIFTWPDTAPYELVDIYGEHYADVEGSMGAEDRPVLHEEYAHISCYNLDELQRDVNVRNFWGESIKKAWENIFTTDGALGGDLWGGIDDVFYIPDGTTERWLSNSDGQTAGYGEWGCVLDAYLREKPEAYLTKKAYSPVRVEEASCYREGELLYVPVKNWFDHTNLNELRVKVTAEEAEAEYPVAESVEPHMEGVITIPDIPADAESVNLKFYTADGIMVDEYQVPLAEMEYHFTPASENPPQVQEKDGEILVSGTGFTVAFDKETGLISRAACQGETLITGGPYLHVTGMELGAWTPDSADGISVRTEGRYAAVTLKGRYANGQQVQFDIKISGNGILTTDYTLTSAPETGSGLKEVGISYDIPQDVESVSWLREGMYSAYPEDHIGRNEGTARKIREGADENPDEYGVEPAWPWKDDMKNYFVYSTDDLNNGLVTNDFKAMREHIRYYNVNYGSEEDAPRISVESQEAGEAARVDVSYERKFVDDRDESVKYTGEWAGYETEADYGGTETYSSRQGDTCEFSFTGTGIRYIGSKQSNTGLVRVYLDGELKETIDTYSNLGNDMKQTVIYSAQNLKEGEHTIRLETGGGNADCIVVDAFEILGGTDSADAQKAKLIVNNQWYYPNLAWGNYTGNPGTLSYGSSDSVTIRLCTENSFSEIRKADLRNLTVVESGKDQVKVTYDLSNSDENTEIRFQWYQTAVGDPESKAELLEGENSEILDVSGLKAYRVYCMAVPVVNGIEEEPRKSNEITVDAGACTFYDIAADSGQFTFEGEKGKDYQTDTDEDWTQDAYEKTMTYLLDTENPASVSFEFFGRGIRWTGAKEINQGIAEVIVDDGESVEIDLCNPYEESQERVPEILFEKMWDAQGNHKITIRRTGKKNEKALAANVSLDAFIVISYEEEPDEAVEAVIEKIQAIGTVTLESKAAIDEARNAYDALTDAQKELVTNLNVLERAEEEYGNQKKAEEERQADEKAAEAVIEKIQKIGTVTLESKGAIDEARNAYEALTDTQKKLVTNLALLEAAEAAYEKLETPDTETPDTETPGTETPGTEEPGTEKPDDPAQPKKELKKGGVYKAGKLYYKVLSTAKREVAVLKPVKKTEKSITIPGNVKLEGISCTVTQIAKNAFRKNKKLTKVTIGKNVQVIGKNAFNGAKKLKKMIIKSKKLKKAYASSIRGISKKAVIQAPKAKKKAYTKLFQIKGKSGVKVK